MYNLLSNCYSYFSKAFLLNFIFRNMLYRDLNAKKVLRIFSYVLSFTAIIFQPSLHISRIPKPYLHNLLCIFIHLCARLLLSHNKKYIAE